MFFDIAARLDAAPHAVEAEDVYGEPFEVEIDGDDFIGLILEALYSEFLIADLPSMLVALSEGDYSPLEYLASYSEIFNYGSSLGMHLSVQCAEEAPFNQTDTIRAVLPEFSRLDASSRDDIASIRATCGVWDVARAGAQENEAVASDVPTLVLAGEFDPITPPSYAREAARSLSRSFVFEFRGATHGVLDQGCPMEIVAAFIDDPESPPDASCIAEMPRFEFSAP
jgi:pimeloyl-ACP methyl ester carboxylesterase